MSAKLKDLSLETPREEPKAIEALLQRIESAVDGFLERARAPHVVQSGGVIALDKQFETLESFIGEVKEFSRSLGKQRSRLENDVVMPLEERKRLLGLRLAGRNGRIRG